MDNKISSRSNLPPPHGTQRYDILKKAEIEETQKAQKELFRATIIVRAGDETMNEEEFVYELIFRPSNPELRLRPEYVQLLLAYYEEMLKQIEGE